MTETEFGAYGFTIGGGAQRRTFSFLGHPGLLEVNIVADRPFTFCIHQPGKLSLPLGHRLEVAVTQEIGLLHPEPWRHTLETGDPELVTFTCFKHDIVSDRGIIGFLTIDFSRTQPHPVSR